MLYFLKSYISYLMAFLHGRENWYHHHFINDEMISWFVRSQPFPLSTQNLFLALVSIFALIDSFWHSSQWILCPMFTPLYKLFTLSMIRPCNWFLMKRIQQKSQNAISDEVTKPVTSILLVLSLSCWPSPLKPSHFLRKKPLAYIVKCSMEDQCQGPEGGLLPKACERLRH